MGLGGFIKTPMDIDELAESQLGLGGLAGSQLGLGGLVGIRTSVETSASAGIQISVGTSASARIQTFDGSRAPSQFRGVCSFGLLGLNRTPRSSACCIRANGRPSGGFLLPLRTPAPLKISQTAGCTAAFYFIWAPR